MQRTILVLLILFLSPLAVASEKIDRIIEVLNLKESVEAATQAINPASSFEAKLDSYPEYAEMVKRHHEAELRLFEQYLSWDELRKEAAAAIESSFTKAEIDAFYQFVTTPHGAAFFEKTDQAGQRFAGTFAQTFEAYREEFTAMISAHASEQGALLAKLESEAPPTTQSVDEPPRDPRLPDVVRFMVATENGEMVGYKVAPGKRAELFERTPFEANDLVLSINGLRVNKSDKIREVYQMTKTLNQFVFEVLRDGERLDFVVDLLELAEME